MEHSWATKPLGDNSHDVSILELHGVPHDALENSVLEFTGFLNNETSLEEHFSDKELFRRPQ